MTGPRLPVKTAKEKAADELRARCQAADREARRRVDANDTPDTASPYDLMADALYQVTADAVFAAIIGPDFAAALHERGYTIVPLCAAPPAPPAEWMHDGIDLIGADGQLTDPLERLHDMWDRAFNAGWSARAAHPDTPQEGSPPCSP